jgi:hypothetical protein
MNCETTILIDGDSSEVVLQLATDPALVVDGEGGSVLEVGGHG